MMLTAVTDKAKIALCQKRLAAALKAGLAAHERLRIGHQGGSFVETVFHAPGLWYATFLGEDARRADGRVVVELKRAWHDGTTHLLFEPIEFLEKLAALTPRPGVNLLLYHGVLAPHARWRRQVTSYGRTGAADSRGGPADVIALPGPEARGPLRYRPWAELMRRAFAIDVLACPQCGGRLRLIATIVDLAAIPAILAAVGLPRAGPVPPAPPAITGGRRRAGPTP